MTSILLKHKDALRKVNISKTYSSGDLGELITNIFQLRDQLSGVTDHVGKFYDLQYLSQHLKQFKSATLNLVTYKEINDDNMSFASSYLDTVTHDKNSKADIAYTEEGIPEQIQQLTKGFFGHVEEQEFFETVFLEEGEYRVLVKTNNLKELPKITSAAFYTTNADANSIVVFDGNKKVCELYLDSWNGINNRIESLLNKVESKPAKNTQPEANKEGDSKRKKAKQQQKPQGGDYSFEPASKEMIMEQLQEKLDSGDITQIEYLRLKCEFYEHPEEFLERYSSNQKESSIDDFRLEIMRSREERIRYQRVLNSFMKPSRELHHRNSEIPIIVRRNNNVIQKISTSYPISPEQQHSIHLIAELQLKGLISENEAKMYKSLILYDNIEVYNVFSEYFNEHIDQIELSKRLKTLKKYGQPQNRAMDYAQPEPLSKLIQKACSPSNIELLTMLMMECNKKVLAAYDTYLLNRDEMVFGQTGDKITSYYRIKQDLDHLQEPGRFEKSKKRISSTFKAGGLNY